MLYWRPGENPFSQSCLLLFCQQHLSELTRCDQNLLCLPWTRATNDSMYMRAILCTTRVMFSSWTLKFTTRALTSHANSCPPGLLGCNTQLSSGCSWTKSTQKYQTEPSRTNSIKKYPHISWHQLPSRALGSQQFIVKKLLSVPILLSTILEYYLLFISCFFSPRASQTQAIVCTCAHF